jgi:hypothetical protein
LPGEPFHLISHCGGETPLVKLAQRLIDVEGDDRDHGVTMMRAKLRPIPPCPLLERTVNDMRDPIQIADHDLTISLGGFGLQLSTKVILLRYPKLLDGLPVSFFRPSGLKVTSQAKQTGPEAGPFPFAGLQFFVFFGVR